MNNEFGLINLWTEGDAVTRFVAILLLAMSLASWVVIILKSLNFLSAQKQAGRIEAFWHSPNVAGGLQALGNEENNPFSALAMRGQEALAHLKTSTARPELLKELDASDWVTRSLQNTIDDATATHCLAAGYCGVVAAVGLRCSGVRPEDAIHGVECRLLLCGADFQFSGWLVVGHGGCESAGT